MAHVSKGEHALASSDIGAGFFHHIAAAAAAETLPRFRQKGVVTNKLAAGFDPVTEADREAEKAIRRVITEAYPAHGILGEEFGLTEGDGTHLWIIDPIDGTRAFISGIPLWGTLVGLIEHGNAVAGMMAQPFTGELFYANSTGAFYEGPGGARQLSTRKTVALAEATLCTTTPALFNAEQRAAYDRIEHAVRLARYGTDCYGYAMIAAGTVDLVIESGLQSYDIAALIPIIEQAGGVVTTWDGGPAENGGNIVAAGTAELHAAAMAMLA
ncbi:histidinol-phosphatase [Mesorhizobium sp. NBSH29]|uniref:histidinol-phosphatase n=1 Tax=Mesorhizobium sp. NBSH29 TaxID=2654249 RepID=UPI0018965A75|nr:histidinol-phosphatase [Mesorhizobium sp. NBSH29]QPC85471.1 histidinol-phosphatase [Mesorhizobium sp. NBSH29]